MTRDELAKMVLLELATRTEAIAAREPLSPWQWGHANDQADREYGPSYSPQWFGDEADTEAGRVRVLRTVRRLADAGLLTIITGSSGLRLERLQLTKAGWKAVAELRKGDDA